MAMWKAITPHKFEIRELLRQSHPLESCQLRKAPYKSYPKYSIFVKTKLL